MRIVIQLPEGMTSGEVREILLAVVREGDRSRDLRREARRRARRDAEQHRLDSSADRMLREAQERGNVTVAAPPEERRQQSDGSRR